jgi:hypothetical protein
MGIGENTCGMVCDGKRWGGYYSVNIMSIYRGSEGQEMTKDGFQEQLVPL